MDNKSYNVDDILAEIKSRKLREKQAENAGQSGSVSAPSEPEKRRDIRQKPEIESETRVTRPFDYSFVEEEFERVRAQTKFVQSAEDKVENSTESKPRVESGRTRPDVIRAEPKTAAETSPPGPKTATDTSLTRQNAEIKTRLRPESAIVQKTESESLHKTSASPSPPEQARTAAITARPAVSRAEPKVAAAPSPPEPKEPASPESKKEVAASPAFNFNADVIPITERAKSRSSMSGTRNVLQRFDFKTDVSPENTAAIELDKSATTSFAPAIEKAAGMGRTRVIPAISAARDLGTDEIRKMDFTRLAAESQTGFYLDDDPDDNMPEGSVIDYSEYNSVNDRRDVQTDIAHVKLWLFIRVSMTVILTAALFIFTLGGRYGEIPLPEFLFPWPETMRAYLLACTILTILAAVVNSSAVGGGLIGLFKMHANSDTLAACAILAVVGQGVVAVANPGIIEPESLNLYFCVASLALLFNGLGKIAMINRILSNFKIIASDQPKKALLIVDDNEFCHEFFKDEIRRPAIVHSVKAGFFTDFLGLSYSDKYDVGINRAVAPVCLVGSIVVAVVTYFLTRSVISAVSAMSAILCVCATLSSTFIENVPLAKLTKKLAPQGGMVSGSKAVEDFCDTRAVILSENDLFPRGHVQLHGIRAFSQARIDEAILDAASVLCKIEGALGPVFLDMIGGNKKLLKKVDNIVFENAMGIAAWVDGRRVLIGNRNLMLNHGIVLPEEVTDRKQASTEAEPLFLSNSGEACAQFTVVYSADEELATELDKLARRDRLLIVHTTDANITAEKMYELYGYPLDLIRILPADRHAGYDEMTAPRETAIAEVVYTGKATTMVKAIMSCVAARSSILSATVIQLIQIVLGYALCTFFAFMGQIGTLDILQICIYQLFWFFAIFIVQQLRHS